jgi:hypothetical protein
VKREDAVERMKGRDGRRRGGDEGARERSSQGICISLIHD